MIMNILEKCLVDRLRTVASKELVTLIPEHGLTTLMCSPSISIPRSKLLKWEANSSRHQDIIETALSDGASVQQTVYGGFIMK